MRIVKLGLILSSFLIYLCCCACIHVVVTLIKPSTRWPVIGVLTHRLIDFIRRILGIHIRFEGEKDFFERKGDFIITRHLSYVDGLVLGSLKPGVFVSKSEIKTWPVIGWVVGISGTVFIDRIRKRKVFHSIEQIKRLLRKQINVFVFPEGTSSDGTAVHPFQSVFFQAPQSAGADIVCVSIKYLAMDGIAFDEKTKDNICWYGDMPFFGHLWNLMKFKDIDVSFKVLRKLKIDKDNRKELSRKCFNIISGAVFPSDKKDYYAGSLKS